MDGETAGYVVLYMLGGFIIGSSTLVAVQFFRRWRKEPHGARLLPLHVWALAISYDLLVITLLSRFDVFTWRALLYGPALLLGVAAMVAMLRYQREAKPDA